MSTFLYGYSKVSTRFLRGSVFIHLWSQIAQKRESYPTSDIDLSANSGSDVWTAAFLFSSLLVLLKANVHILVLCEALVWSGPAEALKIEIPPPTQNNAFLSLCFSFLLIFSLYLSPRITALVKSSLFWFLPSFSHQPLALCYVQESEVKLCRLLNIFNLV